MQVKVPSFPEQMKFLRVRLEISTVKGYINVLLPLFCTGENLKIQKIKSDPETLL